MAKSNEEPAFSVKKSVLIAKAQFDRTAKKGLFKLADNCPALSENDELRFASSSALSGSSQTFAAYHP
jgi:hypothetical protein